MGLLKRLQQFYDEKAEENAELEARWQERDKWIAGSPREAYKKGYKEAYLRFRNPHSLVFGLISMTILGCLVFGNEPNYKYQILNSQLQEAQTKQQRVIDFYQRHGSIPEGVSPAYLDLRTQLWQREVGGGK